MAYSFTRLISALLAFLTMFVSYNRTELQEVTPETDVQIDIIETEEVSDVTETEPIDNNDTPIEDEAMTKRATPIPEDELDGVFASAVADFSDKLYDRIISEGEKENTVVSPLSVIYAMSLIANGADGKTLEEFETTLGNIPIEQLNEYLYKLTEKLMSSEGSTVVVGNSTWANSKFFHLSDGFTDIAKKYYRAEAKSLPFNNKAVNQINAWVSEKTDGMIDAIVTELDPEMALVLINTILFDGKWETEYNDYDIDDGVFFNYDGTTSDVEYLFSQESGSYFTIKGGVGFSKPYKDGYRFTAVLPTGNIDDFMSSVDVSEVITASMSPRGNVKVYIPKFEYEFGTELTDILKDMGIETAMTPAANFRNMSADGVTDTYIGSVIQKAKIILNEKGTKAAAATAVATYGTTSIPVREVPVIRLERPFFYMIVDESGIPLFIGTVYDL